MGLFGKKENAVKEDFIEKILIDGEVIEDDIRGISLKEPKRLVLTSKRVIVTEIKGLSDNYVSIPYKNIYEVQLEVNSKLSTDMDNDLRIVSKANTYNIKLLKNGNIDEYIEVYNKILMRI